MGVVPDDVPSHLVQNLRAPQWTKEPLFGKAKKQVSKVLWIQDTGIKKGGEEQRLRALAFEAEPLVLLRQLSEEFPAMRTAGVPIPHQVINPDSSMGSYQVVRDMLPVE